MSDFCPSQVSELVKLSGGQIDEQLRDQFKDITETILSNQTQVQKIHQHSRKTVV
jgi:hypothetical protein